MINSSLRVTRKLFDDEQIHWKNGKGKSDDEDYLGAFVRFLEKDDQEVLGEIATESEPVIK